MQGLENNGKPWDALPLTIPEELQNKLSDCLILTEEIKKTVWNAEENGTGFLMENGELLCRKEFENITVWAQVKAENGSYTLTDAYFHRMRVRSGE